VLRIVAKDYQETYPQAAPTVKEDFYVYDILTGAPNQKQATSLRTKLNSLLMEAGMTLQK